MFPAAPFRLHLNAVRVENNVYSLLLLTALAGYRTREQFSLTAVCRHLLTHVPPESSTLSQLSSAGAESARADSRSIASLREPTITGSGFYQHTRSQVRMLLVRMHRLWQWHQPCLLRGWIKAQVHEIFKLLQSAQSPRDTKKIREQAFIRSSCQG